MEVRLILDALDPLVLRLLLPLAALTVLSCTEELLVDLAWLWLLLRGRLRPPVPPAGPERRIAVLVPLWQEHEVVGEMLARNIASLRYHNYDFFVGVYPNDPLTVEAVTAAARRWPNVHLAPCPHDGPTSKADCLNWIYQNLLVDEATRGEPFEVVVVHDAEDLIHPDELAVLSGYSREWDFVQIPVLPLQTPLREFTHGTYCDEFAQIHSRDLPVRAAFGGFVPSAGVGTAYTREALQKLAETEANRVFDPRCLTEDYENGLRLHRLGCRQLFLPLGPSPATGPLATREFFPRRWRAAVRQRSRWITGIALQGWELHGWRMPGQRYWLWRDRKGFLTAPITLASAAVFFYGLCTAMPARVDMPGSSAALLTMAALAQVLRSSIRAACSWRWFGARFAALEPLREAWASAITCHASVLALRTFLVSRWRGQPLLWLKTSHSYPTAQALTGTPCRPLGEILTGCGYVRPEDLHSALRSQPPGMRIGEWLVELDLLTEASLYEALSLQAGLPLLGPDPPHVDEQAARALPRTVTNRWKVLPFRIAEGELSVASTEPAPGEAEQALRGFTSLKLRFHLITPAALAATKSEAPAPVSAD